MQSKLESVAAPARLLAFRLGIPFVSRKRKLFFPAKRKLAAAALSKERRQFFTHSREKERKRDRERGAWAKGHVYSNTTLII